MEADRSCVSAMNSIELYLLHTLFTTQEATQRVQTRHPTTESCHWQNISTPPPPLMTWPTPHILSIHGPRHYSRFNYREGHIIVIPAAETE